MAFPKIDMDRAAKGRIRSPKFGRLEPHIVKMLRLLAQIMGIVVGEDMPAVIEVNDTDFTARVAGQAGMAARLDITGAHPLPDL